MKYFYLALLILSASLTFAQTKTVYINSTGGMTSAKDSASIYVVIEKSTDSLYLVKQYTAHDSIILSGSYKDSTISIPNGKFVYYFNPSDIAVWKKANLTATPDSNKYIQYTGSYTNGKKNGVWNAYTCDNLLLNSMTYKDDIFEGPAKYYENGPNSVYYYIFEGNYLNGSKEGDWQTVTLYGKLADTKHFHNDQLVKTTENKKGSKGVIQPVAPVAFKSYLNKQLKQIANFDPKQKLIVKLTVTMDGKVTDIKLLGTGLDTMKNQAIIDLFKKSGTWKPGAINGQHQDMITFCTIRFVKPTYNYYLPHY